MPVTFGNLLTQSLVSTGLGVMQALDEVNPNALPPDVRAAAQNAPRQPLPPLLQAAACVIAGAPPIVGAQLLSVPQAERAAYTSAVAQAIVAQTTPTQTTVAPSNAVRQNTSVPALIREDAVPAYAPSLDPLAPQLMSAA